MKITTLFLLLGFFLTCHANDSFKFDYLSIEEGLSNNSVSCMLQDNDGYLWFGTLNGLNRYDGRQFKTYHYIPGDSTSLSNNKIRNLYQDRLGYIWIQTYDQQLHRLDPRTEAVINLQVVLNDNNINPSDRFLHESSPGVIWMRLADNGCARFISTCNSGNYSLDYFNAENALPSNRLNFIQKDNLGRVWIGTQSGAVVFASDNQPIDTIIHFKKTFFVEDKVNVTAFTSIGDDQWLGTSNGDVFINRNNQIQKIWSNELQADSRITFIELLEKGDVAVGSYNGLLYFDSTKQKIFRYTTANSTLNSNHVFSFYHDAFDDLWLVTKQRGVTRFQVRDKTFSHFELNPEMRRSIVEGEKQLFLEDVNGDLWVGIYGGGVSRFNRYSGQFHQILVDENNQYGIRSNFTLSVLGDKSGNLWIGSYKKGVSKLHLNKNRFNTLKPSIKKQFHNNMEVRAVFEDSRGLIWTGSLNGTVSVYNSTFQKWRAFDPILSQLNSLIESGVYAIYEDSNGNIWIGTKGQGIFIITHINKGVQNILIKHLTHDPDNSNSLSGNDIYAFHEDHFGQMWIAVYHGGLNVVRDALTQEPRFVHFLHDDKKASSLCDNRVRTILQDDTKNLWIGTVNGLDYIASTELLSNSIQFQHITNSQTDASSISNNDVVVLYQDSNKDIWAGTYGGGLNQLISQSHGNQLKWKSFDTKNGLPSNVIVSLVEDDAKKLWIGTDLGMSKYSFIDKSFENYYSNDGIGESIFSENAGCKSSNDYLLFGHSSGVVYFNPDSIYKSRKKIPIVLTDLLVNGKNDNELFTIAKEAVVDTSVILHLNYNQNFLTFEFAALDFKAPDNIQYEFKLDNYEMEWNRNGNVNKAYYKGLEAGDYVLRIKATNSDGVWMNDDLVLHLHILPPFWKSLWALILYAIIISILIWLGRRIILERIRLMHQVDMEKQVVDEKLRFYTSISHEFKTPLSLILGPVDDMLGIKTLPDSVLSHLKMVKRNSMRLLELIEQLMDFRKIQKGYLALSYSKANIVAFLQDIYQTFLPLSQRKNIKFSYSCNMDQYEAEFDYKAIEKIVFNLLSNAFKHTNKGGRITVFMHIDIVKKLLKIEVSDTGIGIAKDNLSQIFNRFSSFGVAEHTNESSSGIGLSLTKELIDLLKGEIYVESTFGEGTKFVVSLPIGIDVKLLNDSAIVPIDDQNVNYASRYINVLEDDVTNENSKENNSLHYRETILIVEDNDDLRNYLMTNLSTQYHVLHASNGKDGVEIAKNEEVDLIISDIMMPLMSGLELTKLLKKEFNTSHIPIVLLTAKSLDEHKIEGIESGADDYITKPFNMEYLQKKVRNILMGRKRLKERYGHELSEEPEKITTSSIDQKFLSDVIKLIEENMTDPEFTVDSLVEHFQFGRTVFYKKMKGISGYSPKEFVSITRMKKAASLLRDPNFNVSQVAFDVGFNDASYFSKAFKKHFGLTPSDYQKSLIN